MQSRIMHHDTQNKGKKCTVTPKNKAKLCNMTPPHPHPGPHTKLRTIACTMTQKEGKKEKEEKKEKKENNTKIHNKET